MIQWDTVSCVVQKLSVAGEAHFFSPSRNGTETSNEVTTKKVFGKKFLISGTKKVLRKKGKCALKKKSNCSKLVLLTNYTDCSYTLPGQTEQAYSVPARHATVPCNVFLLTFLGHLLHLGVKFYNFYRNTPILNIKHNIYEFCLFLKVLYFLS